MGNSRWHTISAGANSLSGCGWVIVLLLIALLPPPSTSAAVLRKMDGTSAEGEIKLDTPGQLTFFPRIGQPQRLPLEDVLLAQFKNPNPEPQAQRWRGQDIGQVQAGTEIMRGGSLTVRGGGANMGANRDDLRFVYQPISGDCQIVARVLSIAQTNAGAIAGVMIRDSLDTAAPYAMCLINASGASGMQYRRNLGAGSTSRSGNNLPAPSYVKVTRNRATFTAYTSTDGQNWDQLGTEALNIRPKALVGIGVCSRNPAAICTATFDQISITATNGPPAAGSGSSGVLLRDGSIVSGRLQSVNTSSIRLFRPQEGELSIPQVNIARVYFSAAGHELAAKAPPGLSGVVDAKGDFFDGDIQSIADNTVVLSSVLFGLRRFEIGQTAAAIFRQSTPSSTAYQVRAVDGSTINTNRIDIEKDQLVAHSPAGPIRFAAAEILDIRAGTASFQPLTELKPASVGPADGAGGGPPAMDGAAVAMPMSLAGNPAARGLGLAAATPLAYNLNGGYRLLSLTWGIPDGVSPLAPARLHILGDNKELYLSPPRTALDDPLPVGVSVVGVKTLLIQVQPVLPAAITPGAFLADPSLVK